MRRLFRNQASFALAALVLQIIASEYCTAVYCQELGKLNKKFDGFSKPFSQTFKYKKFGKSVLKSLSSNAVNMLDGISVSGRNRQDGASTDENYLDDTLRKTKGVLNSFTDNLFSDSQKLGPIKKREYDAIPAASSEKPEGDELFADSESDTKQSNEDQPWDTTTDDAKATDSPPRNKTDTNQSKSPPRSKADTNESKSDTLPAMFSILNNLKLMFSMPIKIIHTRHIQPLERQQDRHVEGSFDSFT